jgi:hypothetical protein
MALLPITPPPGVKTNGTEYSNKNSWVEADLCRFENGYLTNIGGWQKAKETPLVGTPIGMYAYFTNNDERVLAIGTKEKVYVNFRNTWYDITPSGFQGDAQSSPLGYGSYEYDVEDYGDARSQSGLTFQSKPFSFDNFGENLIFCCGSDGRIFKWRPDKLSNGTYVPDPQGLVLANAPVGVSGVLVTNERHIFAFGSSTNPRKISWSSRETDTVWTASATNTAGDIIVTSGGGVQGGVKFGSDIIVFTDTGIQKIYYSGSPFIYGIQDAGENCRSLSMKTVAVTGNFVSWMGDNSFYIYDGRVKKISSDVHDYVFENINYFYRSNSSGGHNQLFSEIWWFFPSKDSKTTDKYVVWNYIDNVWSIGTLDRSVWMDQGVTDFPMACSSTGTVYEHENGSLSGSADIGDSVPFGRTGPIEIAEGDKLVQANQIIPDSDSTTIPGITLSFKGKTTPLGSETDFGSFTFDVDGYQDCRFTARTVTMTVTGDTNQDFQVGNIRLDVQARGKR